MFINQKTINKQRKNYIVTSSYKKQEKPCDNYGQCKGEKHTKNVNTSGILIPSVQYDGKFQIKSNPESDYLIGKQLINQHIPDESCKNLQNNKNQSLDLNDQSCKNLQNNKNQSLDLNKNQQNTEKKITQLNKNNHNNKQNKQKDKQNKQDKKNKQIKINNKDLGQILVLGLVAVGGYVGSYYILKKSFQEESERPKEEQGKVIGNSIVQTSLTATGAVGGGIYGASVGAIAGPVGAFIGAGIGMLGGSAVGYGLKKIMPWNW